MVLFLNLLSTILVLKAATIENFEEKSEAPQIPLLLPVFGNKEAPFIKLWYYEKDSPDIVEYYESYLGFSRSSGLHQLDYRCGEKRMVFGDWKYRKAERNRPSSAIKILDNETPSLSRTYKLHSFNIGSQSNADSLLGRLLRPFEKKMVSLWWDVETILDEEQQLQIPIGELAIGGSNPSRFVPESEIRIRVHKLKPDVLTNYYWRFVENTPIIVGNEHWEKDVFIYMSDRTNIPMAIFDAITKPLRDEMRYTVGLMKGYGRNINEGIMQYHDFNEPIFEFDCKDGPKLLPLRFGPITITPQMMYKKISDEKCRMSLPRNTQQEGQNLVKIGVDLIRHFYFSIVFAPENDLTLLFATRKSGKAPDPPAEPVYRTNNGRLSSSRNRGQSCSTIAFGYCCIS